MGVFLNQNLTFLRLFPEEVLVEVVEAPYLVCAFLGKYLVFCF
jgi:hypothetical protein